MTRRFLYLDLTARVRRIVPRPDPASPLAAVASGVAIDDPVLRRHVFYGLTPSDLQEDIAAILDGGEPIERDIGTDDGWIRLSLAPLPCFERNLEVGGVLIGIEDVSPRVVQERRLRAYLDAIPESLVILSREGEIVAYNRAWQEFGRDNGVDSHFEWRGVNYFGVCSSVQGPEEGDANAVHAGLRAVLEGRQSRYALEYPCHSPTEERWFLMIAVPVPEPLGGLAISHLNITQRVKNEKAARLAQVILDNSAEAVTITNPDETIVYVNTAFTEITGYTPEEAIGRTPRLLASGRHDRAFYEQLWGALHATGRWRGEIWNRRKTGEVYPELVHISAVSDPRQGLTNYVALFSDISTLKANEARLRAINQELEQFASVVSHDLRQPLRGITSYIQLTVRRYGSRLPDEAREFLALAEESGRRMDRLIIDLLDYARIGRGSGPDAAGDPSSPEATAPLLPLLPVVERVIATVRPALNEAAGDAITVTSALPAVRMPETDLERLFQNLIGNAVKYRDPDRPLVVEITARPSSPQGWVSLAICDTGIGIAPEDRERVFAMFQRSSHGMRHADGTGIGLAVCKKIVSCYGGSLAIRDRGDGGAGICFDLTLPV